MTDQPTRSRGVLYIVSGEKYLQAAIHSARSVRKVDPDLPIHLFTGEPASPALGNAAGVFDSVAAIEQPHRRSKLEYFNRSPFEQTLYLDSDTEVVAPLTPLFDVLQRFDIALCHAHWRRHAITSQFWKTPLPASYPQFNSGVILYQRNQGTDAFFTQWQRNFDDAGFAQDQVTLRETLWQSDLRVYTLPPEYNVRFWKYLFLWQASEAKPTILHMQKYHDGPLWFAKNWAKAIGRPVLRLLGIKPGTIRRK